MPRSKHHRKKLSDKEWRKRKNNRIGAARYHDSPNREREKAYG